MVPIVLSALVGGVLLGCGGDDPGAGSGAGGPGGEGGAGATGGAGGTGGEGGAEVVCEPGEVRSCYSGAPGTEGVGLCIGGSETCTADGTGWGPCEDEVVPVDEVCSALGDEDCDGIACSETTWSLAVTGSARIRSHHVAVDAEGNTVFAVTWRSGAIGFGSASWSTVAGEWRMLLAKLDPSGQPLWSQVTDSSASVNNPRLVIDGAGNLIVAGTYSGDFVYGTTTLADAGGEEDVFVMKLDGQGNVVWSRHLAQHAAQLPPTDGPLGNKDVADIAVTDGGDIYLGGLFDGHWGGLCVPNCPVPFGDVTGWLTKLDTAGGIVWQRQVTGTGEESVLALDALDEGVVVGGAFDGNIVVGSDSYNAASGGFSGWVARYDADGNVLWSEHLFDPTEATVTGVSVSGSRILVAGTYADGNPFGAPNAVGDLDLYVSALDHDGVPVWVTTHGGQGAWVDLPRLAEGLDGSLVLSALAQGDLTIAGQELAIGALSPFSASPIVVAYDAQGQARWARGFVPMAQDLNLATDIALAPNGELLVVGRYAESFDIGDQILPFDDVSDAFVARLQP